MDSSDLLSLLASLEGELEALSGLGTGNATVSEVGDGNLNFVYIVSWKKGGQSCSVAVKHAPSYIRCLGPEYSLTKDRLRVEHLALCRFYEAAPGLCPKTFAFKAAASVMIMEDLSGHSVMRRRMIEGDVDVDAAAKVGKFAAAVHRQFRQSNCTVQEWEQLRENFANADMVKLTRQYIFERPYDAEDQTNSCSPELNSLAAKVREDSKVKAAVMKLVGEFSSHRECLVHGDLHSGSVMVCGDSVKVYDGEFAFIGPAAFDVGLLLIQYCMSWIAHRQAHQPDSALLKRLVQALQTAWSSYCQEACLDGDEKAAMWRDALGFGACEGMRRVIGCAHVADLSGLPRAEAAVVRLCQMLLVNRHECVRSVDELLSAMEKFSQMEI